MTQPFKLTTTDRPNAHIGVYLGDDFMQGKVYEFIHVKPLGQSYDYQLLFSANTNKEKMQKYDSIYITTPIRYLFSPKIINILMQFCPDQIQLFDAIVECKDGILTGYKAVNVLNEVDVSDPEKSVYTYFATLPDEISGYSKCVFKKDCMGDMHIVRDAKFHPSIIVSETLKNALEKAKVKGLGFDGGSAS